jgi:hypothetical protein
MVPRSCDRANEPLRRPSPYRVPRSEDRRSVVHPTPVPLRNVVDDVDRVQGKVGVMAAAVPDVGRVLHAQGNHVRTPLITDQLRGCWNTRCRRRGARIKGINDVPHRERAVDSWGEWPRPDRRHPRGRGEGRDRPAGTTVLLERQAIRAEIVIRRLLRSGGINWRVPGDAANLRRGADKDEGLHMVLATRST